jgi:hypothetical protein
MSEKPDGGPAFPIPSGYEHKANDGYCGMSLRDYFAGQALANSTLMDFDQWEVGNERDAARVAYIIADALIAEREK